MTATSIHFTVPALDELASLASWQLEGGHDRDARYRNVVLAFRLTCREHPTLLRGPVVKEFHLAENDARTFRTSTVRTRLRLEKVQGTFSDTVSSKLASTLTGESSAGGGVAGIGRLTSRFSSTLAAELSRSWAVAATRESLVSDEESVETHEESTVAGVADRLKTVTVYKSVKHVEYELRLVGWHGFEIATRREGLVLKDTELRALTHAVPVDALIATTRVWVASGPEQLHTVIRRRSADAWVDEVPAYPPYVADVPEAPRVVTEVAADLASVVERVVKTDEAIQKALGRALEKARRDAGAASKNRAREARLREGALAAERAPLALPHAKPKRPAKPGKKAAKGVASSAAATTSKTRPRAAKRSPKRR